MDTIIHQQTNGKNHVLLGEDGNLHFFSHYSERDCKIVTEDIKKYKAYEVMAKRGYKYQWNFLRIHTGRGVKVQYELEEDIPMIANGALMFVKLHDVPERVEQGWAIWKQ